MDNDILSSTEASRDGFTVWESHLPVKCGIPRKLARDLRQKLARGADWQVVGKRVLWSPDGIERLMALAKNAPPRPAAPADAPADAPALRLPPTLPAATDALGGPLVQTFRVRRIPLNRKVVVATDGKDDLTVRVHDNANYLPGMTIRAIHLSGNLWQLHGRAPRYRGRW